MHLLPANKFHKFPFNQVIKSTGSPHHKTFLFLFYNLTMHTTPPKKASEKVLGK